MALAPSAGLLHSLVAGPKRPVNNNRLHITLFVLFRCTADAQRSSGMPRSARPWFSTRANGEHPVNGQKSLLSHRRTRQRWPVEIEPYSRYPLELTEITINGGLSVETGPRISQQSIGL